MTGFFLSFLVTGIVSAATLSEVTFPDKIHVVGQNLVLNGLGMRRKLIFDVYVAALYLKQKQKDPNAILSSSDPKKLVLEFVRDVDYEKMNDAWDEAYEKNTSSDQKPQLKPLLDELKSLMKSMDEAKEGDLMAFTFTQTSTKVEVVRKGTSKAELEKEFKSKDFGKMLLTIWLGQEPPNESLKEGILGL